MQTRSVFLGVSRAGTPVSHTIARAFVHQLVERKRMSAPYNGRLRRSACDC